LHGGGQVSRLQTPEIQGNRIVTRTVPEYAHKQAFVEKQGI
jgi:hypothetical protein